MSEAIGINFIDEFSIHCTSIVARNKDGFPILSRNLDYDNPQLFQDLTYKAKFIGKKGEEFEGIMIAGMIGVFTGFKKGGYAISLNARYITGQSQNNVISNIDRLFEGKL